MLWAFCKKLMGGVEKLENYGRLSSMVQETTLLNGVRLVTQQVPGMHTITLGIWVANGARQEQPSTNGVAHFIEHLLFKGTERRNARQISREIDSLGGVLNAFTGHEYVCYYAKALTRFLPQVSDILSDMFLNSVFPADEIEKERNVVLQEIKMRDDTPEEAIHDRFHLSFWQGHPLGQPILGTTETISAVSRDAIVAYKNRWYRPSEIVIAAAGGVEHQQLVDLLEGPFSALTPGEPRHNFGGCNRASNGQVLELSERDLEQTLICLGTDGLPHTDPGRYALVVLNTILGGGMSSRLFQEIREKRGLAYSVYSYLSSYSDAGALTVYAGTDRQRSCEAVKIVLAEMGRLRDELVAEDELNAAREQIKGKILMSLESSDSYMSRLARSYLYYGRYQPLEELMAGFDTVTAADLQQLAGRLFRDSSLNVQVMGKVDQTCFQNNRELITL